jgi:asparagine synthase (glutamine-hydrolysing)
MFAFALWDRRARRLLLARDRLGIKPLYYYRDAEKLVFGSEPKAILAHPGVPRAIDPLALEDYLALGVVPGPRSIFKGIAKLPPAHVLSASAEQFDRAPRRYWRLRIEPDERLTIDDWQEAIRHKLDEAIHLHLVSDVPVGAFLSGGLDSSLVVAAAAEASREPLRTFSIGFREESFCELPYARQVAERHGTRHSEEVVTADAAALLGELAYYFDEPFADPSAIPTFLVSRLAARSVKVALSGDGGDEAFGGYARYAHDLREAALRRRIPGWVRRGALGPLGRAWPKADWLPRPLRAKTLLTNLSMDPGPAYANTLSICRPPLRRGLMSPDLAGELDGHDPGRPIGEALATAPREDALGGMIAADVAVILPDDYLVKVDRASMANGLEVRPPLLDHELFELTARIPSRWKVRRGETKWIFKQSVGPQLLPSVLERPKHGFEVPLDHEATVLDPRGPAGDLVDPTVARGLFQAHLAGSGRHGAVLWGLLVLAHWAERYLRPTLPSSGTGPTHRRVAGEVLHRTRPD